MTDSLIFTHYDSSGRASYIGSKSCDTYKIGKIHDLITLKGYSLNTMHTRYIKVYIFLKDINQGMNLQ